MLVLDTDHLGEFQKGTSLAAQRLKRRLDDTTVPVATTVVSVEEVMRGWLAAIRREARPADQIRSYGRLLALFSFYQQTRGACPGIAFMPEPPGYRSTGWLTCLTVDRDRFGCDREAIR